MKEIPLQNSHLVALVDDEDFELVSQYKWWIGGTGYAFTPKPTVYMQQLILGVSDGYESDHKSRDRLDNRRDNLRPATRSQNAAYSGPKAGNSSGYKGVSYDAGKWKATIMKDGKSHYLGVFLTAERAAFVYNRKAKELFGAFAFVNCIPG